jgi:hypothetical protein
MQARQRRVALRTVTKRKTETQTWFAKKTCAGSCARGRLQNIGLDRVLAKDEGCALATIIRVKCSRWNNGLSKWFGCERSQVRKNMKATGAGVVERLRSEVQLARMQVAQAASRMNFAKGQARIARRRRKEAKLTARRAKKQARLAKREVAEAELALAEVESKLANAQQRTSRTKAPQPVKRPRRANSIRKVFRSPKRSATRSSPPTSPRQKSRSISKSKVAKADLPMMPPRVVIEKTSEGGRVLAAGAINGKTPARVTRPAAHNSKHQKGEGL